MEGAKKTIPMIDILQRDCLSSYDSVACTRNVVLCVLSVCTALLCVVRVIRLHMQHSQAYHHYCIFYLATFSCCMGGINWVLGGRPQMHIALQFLKLLMFLVLSHFYWVLASRALRCEAAIKRIMYPAAGVVMVYYIITAVLAMLNMTADGSQCMEPYWLLMSAMEVVLVQFFALAAVHITRRLNEISTLDSVRWAQKRDLWCIVFVLEFSAVVTLLYDITIQIVGDKEDGCGAIFNYRQSLYSPIFGTFMVIKLLIPIWAMLYAFQPNVVNGDTEQTYPAYSEDGTCGSAYSDDSQYRQLYHPTDMYHSVANACLPDLLSSPSPSPSPSNPNTATLHPGGRHTAAGLEPICEEGVGGGCPSASVLYGGGGGGSRKGSQQQGMLAAARNIPKEGGGAGGAKCFSWLTNPSPGKIYL